jgi:hypothetical protein
VGTGLWLSICHGIVIGLDGQISIEIRRVAPDQADRLIFIFSGVFTPKARVQLDKLDLPQLEKPIAAAELRACVSLRRSPAAHRAWG